MSWHILTCCLTLHYILPWGPTFNPTLSLTFVRPILSDNQVHLLPYFPPLIFVYACLLPGPQLYLSLHPYLSPPQQMYLSCFLYYFCYWLPGLFQAKIGSWYLFHQPSHTIWSKEPYVMWQKLKSKAVWFFYFFFFLINFSFYLRVFYFSSAGTYCTLYFCRIAKQITCTL